MSNNTSEFDYQGYLIFNGIYNTNLTEQSEFRGDINEVEAKLINKLGRFQSKSQNSEKGVEKLPLRDYFRDDDSVSDELEEIADDLISLRFIYEDRVEKSAYVSGEEELQSVQIPVIKDADIYWDYPNYMFFRGAKSDVDEAVSYISDILGTEIATDGGSATEGSIDTRNSTTFERLSFGGDFLLWVFYKYFNDESLASSGIEIDRLTDAATTGDFDVWGGNNMVGDSSELGESPPLLSALLQNKSLKMLEGGFALEDNTVQAEVQINKVHIKSSVKSIKRSNDTRRIALSIRFLRELVELQNSWTTLNQNEKYPPYDFFLELYGMCKDHGMTLDNISETLRREICTKRGDNEDDWDIV